MARSIFCEGEILDHAQRLNIYEDCKTFVDLHLKDDPDKVLAEFATLKLSHPDGITKDVMREFVDRWFDGPGEELEDWTPTDWKPRPSILSKLKCLNARRFVEKLNELWCNLGKKMKNTVSDKPDRYSFLPVPNPFVIPGDRFRESYYWDTYWIIGGLLACDMTETVRGILGNFAHFVNTYGMIPNGGRLYYTGRSQPPLFLPMVDLYYQKTGNVDFIRQNIKAFSKEMEFWLTKRSSQRVRVSGKMSFQHLVTYAVSSNAPRPEGYREDIRLAADLPKHVRGDLYSQIQAACQSGWDFSSRWFKDYKSIKTIKTSRVIPLDLNCFLHLAFKTLAKFYHILGEHEEGYRWEQYAEFMQEGIDEMWDEETGVWCDWIMDNDYAYPRRTFYVSNLTPLFTDSFSNLISDRKIIRLLDYVNRNCVGGYPGGPPTSLLQTGEQWDYPNVWPPLVHMLIQGLDNLGHHKAKEMAKRIAIRWISSNLQAFLETGSMFEKYNCITTGKAGSGGEYNVQLGFGWTNGVCLMLLDKYADSMNFSLSVNPVE